VIWGAIIAVAVHPFFAMVRTLGGNRNMLAGVLLTLLFLSSSCCQLPGFLKSLIEGIESLINQFKDQTLVIPPPGPSVAGWPLIGKPISEIWFAGLQEPGIGYH